MGTRTTRRSWLAQSRYCPGRSEEAPSGPPVLPSTANRTTALYFFSEDPGVFHTPVTLTVRDASLPWAGHRATTTLTALALPPATGFGPDWWVRSPTHTSTLPAPGPCPTPSSPWMSRLFVGTQAGSQAEGRRGGSTAGLAGTIATSVGPYGTARPLVCSDTSTGLGR